MCPFRTIEVSQPAFEREGLKFVTVKSSNLRGRGDITVYVPPGPHNTPLPMVTLLHGVYGSHWSWAFQGNAHRIAAELIDAGHIPPMILVMPSDGLKGDGTAYAPHSHANYETWIAQDLRSVTIEIGLPITEKSLQFIAGLSMGGYAAMRLGAKYAQTYHGIAAMSALTDLMQLTDFIEEPTEEIALPTEEQNIGYLLTKTNESIPPLHFNCGLSDPLLRANRELHEVLNASGIAHDYAEHAGDHDWEYWRNQLPQALMFFAKILAQCSA